MNEIRRTVDELRFILQREVIEQSDELTNLVKEYSELCHEVNIRLRRCDECVKQGLKGEAVHLAESKPNLLDAVAILDFPERHELLDIVSMYFMTPPEPLLIEVASALNEAYAEHAPLLKLLDTHRLLALGCSPLVQRLSVLRSLAELDPLSPHWDVDVREMEHARFRELESESVAAAKAGDTTALKSLVDEVSATNWREAIPPTVVRNLKMRATQTVRGNAREEINELNSQLYTAFSALDAAAARPLREAWKPKRQLAQLTDKDPLVEQVAPIFHWLDDEDRKAADSRAFAKIVAEIEQTLDNEDNSVEELNRLKLAADRLQRSLPVPLETRLRTRVNTLELMDGRRKKLIVGAGVGAFAIVAGIFGMIVYLSSESEKTRRLVAAVTAFIDDGKLSEAQKLINDNPSRSTSESWLAVKKTLADAELAERDRVMQWKAEVATARESNDSARIGAALKQARELSKTAEEKIEVGQLQSTWQKRVNEATAERERTFRESITATTAALKALDVALSSSDADQIRPKLDAADEQINRLLPLRESVAKELSSQATLLESRWKASHQTFADLGKRKELLDRITDAVLLLPEAPDTAAKHGRFEVTLREFTQSLPNDPRTAAMNQATEMNPLPVVTVRQKLIERWKQFQPKDQKDAQTRIKEIRTFFEEHPQSPDRDLLGRYEGYLASIVRRFEDNGDAAEGIQRRLTALFNGRFLKEAHVLIDDDYNTYYLPKERKEPFGSVVSFSYLTGFNGETAQVTLKPDKLLTPKTVAPPQQELAANVRASIRNITPTNWREYFRDLTNTLLTAEKLDPFLRYNLVLKTLEFAGRGDQLLEVELVPLLDKLRDDQIDRSIPWIDPKSKAVEEVRRLARERLSKLPPIEPYFTAAGTSQEQFERAIFAPLFSVGWLEKSPRGEWVFRTKWKPEGEYELRVVTRPDPTGLRKWSPLGRIKDHSITVDPSVAQLVGEGSVVFATSSATDPKTAFVPQP